MTPDFELRSADDGPVRTLTLARPARLNALHDALLQALADALKTAADDGVRALILRGDGDRAFSAGYDLGELPEVGEGALPDAILEAALARIDAAPFPVVALVNGHAFGGGLELAARCDVRIAVGGARLGMPPAKLGIVYAPRGLARFWALCGPSVARRMFFTGETLTALQAQDAGLLDEVLPTLPDAEARARAVAHAIAANAPLAVSGMRRIFRELEASLLSAVEGPAIEALRRQAFASEDVREGLAAFMEKRAPRFAGK
jgi:enoyl-CoA hydratase/carnithine racemase